MFSRPFVMFESLNRTNVTLLLLLSATAATSHSVWWIERHGLEYYVSESRDNSWHDANEWCVSQGGNLAKITSDEQREDVKLVVQVSLASHDDDEALWIGLQRSVENEWRWSDGSTVDAFSLPQSEAVIDTLEDTLLCGQTRVNDVTGLWSAAPCESKARFVCSRTPRSSGLHVGESQPTDYCPYGYFEAGEKCFRIFSSAMIGGAGVTWHKAGQLCRSEQAKDATLAIVSNADENNAILAQLKDDKEELFIGLYRAPAYNSPWLWIDNTSLVGYSNWATGKPSYSSTELCAVVWTMPASPASWNNINCDYPRGYICQASRELSQPSTTPGPRCPLGYTSYWFGCYKMYEQPLATWSDASTACRSDSNSDYDVRLVSIHGPSENAFLQLTTQSSITGSQRFWTGLRYFTNGSFYYWEDDWHVTYTNWGSGQPSRASKGSGCVGFDSATGKWFDQLCNETRPFVCWTPVQDASVRTTPAPVDGDCPLNTSTVNWVAHDRFCYSFSVNSRSWQSAEEACRKDGGEQAHLASVHSVIETYFIENLARSKDSWNNQAIWIGLTKDATDDSFRWTDGSEVEFTNWVGGRPPTNIVNGTKYCAKSLLTGYVREWESIKCQPDSLNFVCQVPMSIRPTSPAYVNGTCPDQSWTAYGDQCFQFKPDVWLTADEAHQECVQLRGQLATIRTLEENFFVQSQLWTSSILPYPRGHWIGLEKELEDLEFQWPDDHPVNFTYWKAGHPGTSETRQCVQLNSDVAGVERAEWTAVDCDKTRIGFVCSTPMQLPPPDKPTKSGSDGGLVAGIVIAVLVVIVAMAAAGYYYVTKFQVLQKATNAGIGNLSYDADSQSDGNHKDQQPYNGVGKSVEASSTSYDDPAYLKNKMAEGNAEPKSVWVVNHAAYEEEIHTEPDIAQRLGNTRVTRLSFQH